MILQETTGQVVVCDGCGRLATSPGLVIQSYVVDDPNIGSKVTNHFCGGCAQNRGLPV